MMKKALLACACVAALVLLMSCGGKKEDNKAGAGGSGTSTVEPIIDTSKAKTIDEQLAAYDQLVTRYLADKKDEKTDAVTADEQELATIGEQLSMLAADFNADQLAKYNETTAKLSE